LRAKFQAASGALKKGPTEKIGHGKKEIIGVIEGRSRLAEVSEERNSRKK